MKTNVKRIAIAQVLPARSATPIQRSQRGQLSVQGGKPTLEALRIAFSSATAVLSVCHSANAQLNVGRSGVQPGLEQNYLQYQFSGQDLNEMQSISACKVGFGLSCNKTGAIVQQLLESNNGPSYEELLIQAAGGVENFRNFSSFYNNNPNLSRVPYAAFWRNDSSSIMDGYQYLLGSPVSRTPVEGLGLVTKSFYWAPLSRVDNSLSPRSGLLNLKYSFGRLLFEEVSKIPNVEQQIQSMDLPPNIRKFYLGKLFKGLGALNTGDEKQLQESILELLSHPFSPNGGEFGRPNIGIPKEFDLLFGKGLPGDDFVAAVPVSLEGEAIDLDIFSDFEGDVFVQEGSGNRFPGWLVGVGGGLALLLLLFLSGDSSSAGQPLNADTPDFSYQPSPSIDSFTPIGNGPFDHNPFVEIPSISVTPQPQTELKQVPEPPIVTPLLLLMILMCMLNYKQRRMHKT